MDIQEIINNIAAGDNLAAKEGLENALSAKAFDALQDYKKEIAATLYAGQEQESEEDTDHEEDEEVAYAEEVEHDGEQEQLDELSHTTLKRYTNKAQDSYSAAVERKDDAENRANHIIISGRGGDTHADYHKKRKEQLDKAQKTMKKRAKGIYRAWDRTKPGWDKD